MPDPEYRRKGLFVGSGVIEAGCKTVIGSRLKRSGMFWTVRGANAVIALRCCRHSRQFRRLLGAPPHMIAHPESRTLQRRVLKAYWGKAVGVWKWVAMAVIRFRPWRNKAY